MIKMRSIVRTLAVFLLMGTTLVLTGASGMAAEPEPIPGLDKTGSEITVADLDRFLDLALTNHLTVEEVRAFYGKLGDAQIATIGALLDDRAKRAPRSPQTPPARSTITGNAEQPSLSAFASWSSYIYLDFIWP